MSLMTLEISHGVGRGTMFRVWASPLIEDFIKSLGDGTTQPVPPGGFVYSKEGQLHTYRMGNGEFPSPQFEDIQLDAINRPFTLDDGDSVINLSFLRLKGISDPDGVTFFARTIIAASDQSELKIKIGRAVRTLCREYIVPSTAKISLVED